MKTRGWKMENGGWPTRSVLECGSPLPLSTGGAHPAAAPSAGGLVPWNSHRAGVEGSLVLNSTGLAQSKTWWRGLLLFCFLPSAFCFRALGQSYSIDWYKIAGGGGTSTGGVYSVSGTIGQPDAGGAMTGGNYSLTGGFWALISVVQTPGLPNLIITHTGNSVMVSWPDTGSYTLQQNGNLADSNGWGTSGYAITTANGTNSITITPPAGNLFFRLKQ